MFSTYFSFSFDSETSLTQEYPEIEMRKFVSNNQAIVPNEVAEYIQRLLKKIADLASKAKKLRLQREKLRYKLAQPR